MNYQLSINCWIDLYFEVSISLDQTEHLWLMEQQSYVGAVPIWTNNCLFAVYADADNIFKYKAACQFIATLASPLISYIGETDHIGG